MSDVLKSLQQNGAVLREEALPGDEIGRLTDKTAEVLRQTGLMRMLQPKEWGGDESHPTDFLEAVMEVGHYQPSAAWVCGVVGLHPWEVGMIDPQAQAEIWGEDNSLWVASPYAPLGKLIPVEGGFRFSGQWPYSTGTDHCEWIVLGGLVTDQEGVPVGNPPEWCHVFLPRKDYEILEGTWNVLGLLGTGSKDVRVTDVFVPDHRVVKASEMNSGALEYRQEGKPLYKLKLPLLFSASISAATQGIAQGALAVYREYMESRVAADGTVARTDTTQLNLFAEASADIAASKVHLLHSMTEIFDYVSKGGELTRTQRLTFRRDQVRASRRVVDAIDKLYKLGGAASIHLNRPNQRYWRDLQTGFSHICNVAEGIYTGWSIDDFGGEASPGLFV